MSESSSGGRPLFNLWRPGVCWFWGLCLAAVAHGDPPPAWPGLKDITPESLTHCFAGFAYELSDQVQDGAVFLERKRGDCADFAKLVSETLNHHGYTSKLVVVMMEKQTHVVCYVKESNGYLDYNLRTAARPIVSSDGTLEDIADKVAASFHSKWRMASEIRYQGVVPVFIFSAFPPARPPAERPVRVAEETTPLSPGVRPVAMVPGVLTVRPADAKTADAAR